MSFSTRRSTHNVRSNIWIGTLHAIQFIRVRVCLKLRILAIRLSCINTWTRNKKKWKKLLHFSSWNFVMKFCDKWIYEMRIKWFSSDHDQKIARSSEFYVCVSEYRPCIVVSTNLTYDDSMCHNQNKYWICSLNQARLFVVDVLCLYHTETFS